MTNDLGEILAAVRARNPRAIGRAISLLEERNSLAEPILAALSGPEIEGATVLGITGPGGSGKSTLIDQLIAHHRGAGRRVGVVAIDPSSPLSGGALLGDRIRMMRHAADPGVVVRSMATRGRMGGLCAAAGAAARLMALSGCDPVIIETVGVGQAEIDVVSVADASILVMAPGFGDEIQAMKAGLIELADILVVNKADAPGAEALALEMEAVARERNRPFFKTCATSGAGVAELAQGIVRLSGERRASGRLAELRRSHRNMEALDWAIETIRPRIAAEIHQRPEDHPDPRKVGLSALEALGIDLSRNPP